MTKNPNTGDFKIVASGDATGVIQEHATVEVDGKVEAPTCTSASRVTRSEGRESTNVSARAVQPDTPTPRHPEPPFASLRAGSDGEILARARSPQPKKRRFPLRAAALWSAAACH